MADEPCARAWRQCSPLRVADRMAAIGLYNRRVATKARSSSTAQPVERASAHDREYMRRLGRWKHESHAEVQREHLALPLAERLLVSLAWSIDELPDWRWSRNGVGPAELRERAKRLGLYRG